MTVEALRRELSRLDGALRDRGVRVAGRGATPVALRPGLAGVDVTPPPGVVAWWEWVGDGLPPDEGWARFVTPRHRLITFDHAVTRYREHVDTRWDEWRALTAAPGWLPLLQLAHGGLLVADCSDPAAETVTVKAWNADSGVGGDGALLATVVGWWVALIESESWVWRDGSWEDHLDDASLPAEQRMTFLF